MKEKARYKIPLLYKDQVRSLCWVNDHLVDFAGDLAAFHLDGKIIEPKINYAYRFNGAVATPDGEYAVIYEKLGTKGLVLKRGERVREIDRSYYCAQHYEFPVAIFSYEGKVCIAHCPDEYNIIEIEEIETGKRITQKDRPATDFFQSRLQISPDRKWLLSAGWIWHPLDAIEVYDLSAGISDPKVFSPFWDESPSDIDMWEINNAVFTDDSRLLMSGTGEDERPDETDERSVIIYDLTEKRVVSRTITSEPTGKLMPLGGDFAVGFYKNPKLIDIRTGEIVYKWLDIKTDEQDSSIYISKSPIALDQKNKRFAVATEESIEVIVLD